MGLKLLRVVCLLGLAAGAVGCLVDGPPGAVGEPLDHDSAKADRAGACAAEATAEDGECASGCPWRDPDCDNPTTDLTLTLRQVYGFRSDAPVVSAWFDHGFASPSTTQSAVLAPGADTVTLTWPGEFRLHSYGAFVHVWVDTDGNRDCGAADDVFSVFVSNTFSAATGGVSADLELFEQRERHGEFCEVFERTPEVVGAAFDCAATCDGARASAGCFRRDACVEFCSSRVAHASDRVREAFEMCALVNPLCYEREDDCIEGVVERFEACDERGIGRDECLADSRFRTVSCIEACEADGAERATCLESCGSF